MTVDQVKIHHEGGGQPNDVPKDGYSGWIGATGWQLVRPPWEDWSTKNLNHVVMGVCFSGQRESGIQGDPAHPVTDQELVWLNELCNEARRRGWITNIVQVTPHDNLFGSATVCPGTTVYARWVEVVNNCQIVYVPVPAPEDDDMESYAYPHGHTPSRFAGAVIDRANNRVTLYNGAKIDQPTVANTYWGAPNPNKILTSYDGRNALPPFSGFVVVTADTDEYRLAWV